MSSMYLYTIRKALRTGVGKKQFDDQHLFAFGAKYFKIKLLDTSATVCVYGESFQRTTSPLPLTKCQFPRHSNYRNHFRLRDRNHFSRNERAQEMGTVDLLRDSASGRERDRNQEWERTRRVERSNVCCRGVMKSFAWGEGEKMHACEIALAK